MSVYSNPAGAAGEASDLIHHRDRGGRGGPAMTASQSAHRTVLIAALRAAPLAFALFAACDRSPPEPADTRPNMVFVLLDDVRADDIYDHPFAELPNIEELAAQGARFDNFFTVAPLCSPSRAVFLTGQYPHNNGILDNRERAAESHAIRTFPRLLNDAGYRSAFVGKWHMGHEDASPRPGFDHWVSFVGQGVYFDPEMNVNGRQAFESGYMTDILTRYATQFIRGAERNSPFVLFVAHKAVHPEILPGRVRSFPPAPGDEALYDAAELPRSPNWQAALDGKPALARITEYDDPRSPPGGTPDDVIKGRLRMLSAVDRSIGEIVAALEETGRLDNTVVVLTSDQGFFYGEFGLAQERRLAYEPSIRIPLIVRYPALATPGSIVDDLAANVDVAPTMLELGGVVPPSDMDGRSMVPLMREGGDPNRRGSFLIEYYSDDVFARIVNMGYRALRTDRYKYIRYEDLEGMDELYDLSSDPFELDNILRTVDSAVLDALDAEVNALVER